MRDDDHKHVHNSSLCFKAMSLSPSLRPLFSRAQSSSSIVWLGLPLKALNEEADADGGLPSSGGRCQHDSCICTDLNIGRASKGKR